jgi:hypothetical protein
MRHVMDEPWEDHVYIEHGCSLAHYWSDPSHTMAKATAGSQAEHIHVGQRHGHNMAKSQQSQDRSMGHTLP